MKGWKDDEMVFEIMHSSAGRNHVVGYGRRAHLNASFEHCNARVLVVFESSLGKAETTNAVATATWTHLTVPLILPPKNRERF